MSLTRLLILAIFFLAAAPAAAVDLEPLRVHARSGVHVFHVEVADTPDERARGLMFRTTMPADQGMLFDFESDRLISMWMKNTFIALDMLFIDAGGRVAKIVENTVPQSLTTHESGRALRFVLELRAGTVATFGFAVGDRVEHRKFSGSIANP